MRIDRSLFLALALGSGPLVTACASTKPAAAPVEMAPDEEGAMMPDGEGGYPDMGEGPTMECVEWDMVGECIGWEEMAPTPDFVEE